MTSPDELMKIAKSALRDARHQLAKTGRVATSFRAFKDGGNAYFEVPEEASSLLNSGIRKEMLFDVLRRYGAEYAIEMWLFVSDAHRRQQTVTAKDAASPTPGWNDAPEESEEEAIIVTAQNATDVVMVQQVYMRKNATILWIGPPLEQTMKQEHYGGRTKMYHATRGDIVGFDPDRMASPGPYGADLLAILEPGPMFAPSPK